MALTQANIDEGVLIGKNVSYRLASELAIENRLGGDISCCFNRLKQAWLFTKTLACQIAGDENCLTDSQIKSLIGKIKSFC